MPAHSLEPATAQFVRRRGCLLRQTAEETLTAVPAPRLAAHFRDIRAGATAARAGTGVNDVAIAHATHRTGSGRRHRRWRRPEFDEHTNPAV